MSPRLLQSGCYAGPTLACLLYPSLVVFLLLSLGVDQSWAQSTSSDTPRSKSASVNYQAVDRATLRVFAIGTVGLETIVSDDGLESVKVASPKAGHGTGFMVGGDGLLLTAQHVIDGAQHVVVRLPGQAGFTPARVVYQNSSDDIAVLSIAKSIPAIELANRGEALSVRQTVYAIGYPLDPARSQAQSARGIVAGELDNGTLQLDISVNPGNSGGPLVDEKNRVVGMVVARGNVKAGVQGMGFAVPRMKLATALSIARQTLELTGRAKLEPHEVRSAAVFD